MEGDDEDLVRLSVMHRCLVELPQKGWAFIRKTDKAKTLPNIDISNV